VPQATIRFDQVPIGKPFKMDGKKYVKIEPQHIGGLWWNARRLSFSRVLNEKLPDMAHVFANREVELCSD